MRRHAGEYLREQLQDRVLVGGTLILCGIAWLFGGLLSATTDASLWLVLGVPVGWIAAGTCRLLWGWRLNDVRTGARTEEKAGEAIEYALTRDTCAVAHGVTEIARHGDIDHLVATPSGLWVVETKSRRLPRRVFVKTLRRIVANVEAVRDWAPPGVRVTGVLAFAGDKPVNPKESYEQGAETIRCFGDPESLVRHLRNEASREGSLGPRVVRDVWMLGKRPDDDNPPAEPARDRGG